MTEPRFSTAPESDLAYVLEAGSNARLLTVRGDYDAWWDGLGEAAQEADEMAAYGWMDKYASFVEEFAEISRLRQEVLDHQNRLRRDTSYAEDLDEFGKRRAAA